MTNVTGNIVLNGLNDREMARIWEMKAKYGEAFNFVPNMQVIPPNQMQQRPGYPQQQPHYPFTTYNNVTFSWTNVRGLEIVHEVISYLLKKEEAEAVGQQ